MPCEIDVGAPVKAAAQDVIHASPETVWALLTDFMRWPEWNSDVSAMTIDGPVAPGTRFVWKGGGLTIRSQLVEVAGPGRIVWTGRTMGIDAIHVWTLAPQGAGQGSGQGQGQGQGQGTLVSTAESFRGLLPSLLPGMMRRNLEQALAKGIAMLRTAAEAQALA